MPVAAGFSTLAWAAAALAGFAALLVASVEVFAAIAFAVSDEAVRTLLMSGARWGEQGIRAENLIDRLHT